MKRFAIALCVSLVLISAALSSVPTRQDKVLASIGKYDEKQLWTHGAFQDYTDFGIYTYPAADLKDNPYFLKVSPRDMQTISAFLDDFENWVSVFRNNDPADELAGNYRFDRSVIDTEDYVYIYEEDRSFPFECYDLWLYDSQSNTLYYFHNNI